MADETIIKGYEYGCDAVRPWPYRMADGMGDFFSCGLVGGFTYHLAKGLLLRRPRQNFGTALRLACHKAPQVGGACVGFYAALTAVQFVDLSIRGKDDFYSLFFASAFGGAAVRAKHGIISASRSALCIGTLFTLTIVWRQQLEKTRDQQNMEAYLAANKRPKHDPNQYIHTSVGRKP